MTGPSVTGPDRTVFTACTVGDLTAVAAVISQRGWARHTLVSSAGVCLLGGVWLVAPSADRQTAMRRALEMYLSETGEIDYYGGGAGDWNDAPGRRVDDVLDLITKTIDWIKEKICG